MLMSIWDALTSNYIINVGFTSFALAQLIKTALTFLATRRFDPERLVGAGGMPSSHSALTASISVAMARKLGFASPLFGLSIAFASIVIYDAMGVRRAAGEQAKVLNKMMFEIPLLNHIFGKEETGAEEAEEEAEQEAEQEDGPITEPIRKALKEYIGHTPMEVLGGCLLGILIAMYMDPF